MPDAYPALEPYASGMLERGAHSVYWETCGNPLGTPALVVHGGPGSGCLPWHRTLFDPEAYRVVLFDQRGCGRSRPHAGDSVAALSDNTTADLIGDIEALREELGVDRWVVLGGSWGSLLGLVYALAFPARVARMVLWGVATGRRTEADWLFRGGVARLFPAQWERLCAAIPPGSEGEDIVDAYRRLLLEPDPAVHNRAAHEWCLWESATPDWPPATGLAARFQDPRFALGFARLVTHYIHHNAWLPDEGVLPRAAELAAIPATIINGRFDLQSPLENAWKLHSAWPGSELVVVDDAGHAAGAPPMTEALVQATDTML